MFHRCPEHVICLRRNESRTLWPWKFTHCFATPSFESFLVGRKVCIDNFGYDVLPQLPLEALMIKSRVKHLHQSLYPSSFIFIKPWTDGLRHRSHWRYNRIFRLVVSLAHWDEASYDGIWILETIPCFLSWRILMQNKWLSSPIPIRRNWEKIWEKHTLDLL